MIDDLHERVGRRWISYKTLVKELVIPGTEGNWTDERRVAYWNNQRKHLDEAIWALIGLGILEANEDRTKLRKREFDPMSYRQNIGSFENPRKHWVDGL